MGVCASVGVGHLQNNYACAYQNANDKKSIIVRSGLSKSLAPAKERFFPGPERMFPQAVENSVGPLLVFLPLPLPLSSPSPFHWPFSLPLFAK